MKWIGALLMVFASLETIQAPPTYTQYLPMVKREGLPPAAMGVQVDDSISRYEWEQYIIPNRMYQFPARWAEIEAEPGEYNWTPWLDENVQIVSSIAGKSSNSVTIGTKTTPAWARMWSDELGSPPAVQFWNDYAHFVNEIIARYDPWAVELWNEPDTQPQASAPEYYGAWIPDNGDPYLAGYHYGNFTRYVVPIVKAAHPDTKLIVGALMGDMRFLQGAVAGGLTGDYLSIHHYLSMASECSETFAKVNEARQLSDIPIIITETSVIGDDSQVHRERQAEYLEYLKDAMAWKGVPLIMWYSLGNDWNNTALVRNGQTTPAWKEWSR